jgi:hypothetical protein
VLALRHSCGSCGLTSLKKIHVKVEFIYIILLFTIRFIMVSSCGVFWDFWVSETKNKRALSQATNHMSRGTFNRPNWFQIIYVRPKK